MIELNIQDLRKRAKIKFSGSPEGHVFAIRRETPGDELALSELSRKRSKLIIKVTELQQKSLNSDEMAPEEKDSITKEIEEVIAEIDTFEQEELKIKSRIYDDGGDGTLSALLYNELSADDREALINAVMNGTNIEKDK